MINPRRIPQWSPGSWGGVSRQHILIDKGILFFLLNTTTSSTAQNSKPDISNANRMTKQLPSATLEPTEAPTMTEQQALNREAMNALLAKYPNLADPEQGRQYMEELKTHYPELGPYLERDTADFKSQSREERIASMAKRCENLAGIIGEPNPHAAIPGGNGEPWYATFVNYQTAMEVCVPSLGE